MVLLGRSMRRQEVSAPMGLELEPEEEGHPLWEALRAGSHQNVSLHHLQVLFLLSNNLSNTPIPKDSKNHKTQEIFSTSSITCCNDLTILSPAYSFSNMTQPQIGLPR